MQIANNYTLTHTTYQFYDSVTSQVVGDKSTPEAIDHLETGLLAKKKQGVTNQWNRPRSRKKSTVLMV